MLGLNGQEKVDWRLIESSEATDGPWIKIITQKFIINFYCGVSAGVSAGVPGFVGGEVSSVAGVCCVESVGCSLTGLGDGAVFEFWLMAGDD
jgi:hypothetical protein